MIDSQKIKVIPYSETMQEEWDSFVEYSRNGTIFTTQKFLGYHPPGRFDDHSLLFKKKGRLIAVLPAAVRDGASGKVLYSHPGSNHGGIILDMGSGIDDACSIVDSLINYARVNGFAQILVRNPERIYQVLPTDEIDFALLFHGFSVIQRDLSTVIPLDFFKERGRNIFEESCRRAIRKAEKSGVEVMETDDYPLFWKILDANLTVRYGKNPTHSLEDIQMIKKLFPENIRFFGAYLKGLLIAGVVLFVCNRQGALAFYISDHKDYQIYRPLNLVHDRIVEWCLSQGLKFYNFGYSTENAGTGINWGLFRFKESFGGKGIIRETSLFDLTAGKL